MRYQYQQQQRQENSIFVPQVTVPPGFQPVPPIQQYTLEPPARVAYYMQMDQFILMPPPHAAYVRPPIQQNALRPPPHTAYFMPPIQQYVPSRPPAHTGNFMPQELTGANYLGAVDEQIRV